MSNRKVLLVTLLVIFLYSLGLGFYLKERKRETSNLDLTFTDTVKDKLLNKVGFKEASIFLYNNDFSFRYLLTSSTEVVNPFSPAVGDSFFPKLLDYNYRGICTALPVIDLPNDSNLYKALIKKGFNTEDSYYLACPIEVNNTLVGYISTVIIREDGALSVNLQALKYYASVIGDDLEDLSI